MAGACDQGKIAVMAKLISSGLSNRSTAAKIHINENTFYDWINRGTQDQLDNKDTIHAQFSKAYKESLADFEAAAIESVKAQTERWQASAWLLERKQQLKGEYVLSNPEVEEMKKKLDDMTKKVEEALKKEGY